MEITVLLFGQAAELVASKQLTLTSVIDTNTAVSQLKSTYPQLASINFSVALNTKLLNENTTLNNGDVLAILPPYSGG